MKNGLATLHAMISSLPDRPGAARAYHPGGTTRLSQSPAGLAGAFDLVTHPRWGLTSALLAAQDGLDRAMDAGGRIVEAAVALGDARALASDVAAWIALGYPAAAATLLAEVGL